MLDPSSPFAAALPPGAEPMSALAFKRLRRAVVGAELHPGSLVGEHELAERYLIGRASVRVALTRLACAGLVEARARHGWLIVPVTGLLIGEVVAARRTLEPSLADIRLSPRDGERVSVLVAMNQVLRGQGASALLTARTNDRQILEMLAQCLDGLRRRWLGEAWDHAERIDAWLAAAGEPRWPSDRHALVTALLDGSADAAKRAIEADIAGFEAHAARFLLRSPSSISIRRHDGVPGAAHVPRQQARTPQGKGR